MSLNAKILSLLSGIVGVNDRVGIAGSIFYICDLYLDGHINEDKARDEIYDICFNVLRAVNFDLTDDEVKKKANMMTEEIMRAVKLEGARRRLFSSLRPRPSTTTRTSSLF